MPPEDRYVGLCLSASCRRWYSNSTSQTQMVDLWCAHRDGPLDCSSSFRDEGGLMAEPEVDVVVLGVES